MFLCCFMDEKGNFHNVVLFVSAYKWNLVWASRLQRTTFIHFRAQISSVFFLAHLSGFVGFHLFQYFGITVTDKHFLTPEQLHRSITSHSLNDMVRAAYLRQVYWIVVIQFQFVLFDVMWRQINWVSDYLISGEGPGQV